MKSIIASKKKESYVERPMRVQPKHKEIYLTKLSSKFSNSRQSSTSRERKTNLSLLRA